MKAREVRALLEAHGIRPRKGLGQNFLLDETVLDHIVAAAHLSLEDIVVEIGPGLGVLTARLLEHAGHVVAVELDDKLVEILRDRFAGEGRLHLVHGDILQVDVPQTIRDLLSPPEPLHYKVVANLPYAITSPAIRHLLESAPPPDRIVLLVQREVAERIAASPGDMNLLAVRVQLYGRPRIVARVPAGAFYPRPKVESAVLEIVPHSTPPVQVEDLSCFLRLVEAGFHQPRKQLRNALAAGLGLPKQEVERLLEAAGIDPRRRAETLSLQEWERLYRAFITLAPQPDQGSASQRNRNTPGG